MLDKLSEFHVGDIVFYIPNSKLYVVWSVDAGGQGRNREYPTVRSATYMIVQKSIHDKIDFDNPDQSMVKKMNDTAIIAREKDLKLF
jgi:hypothetical protein